MTLPMVICAWCPEKGRQTVLREGTLPVSHGMCGTCLAELEAALAQEEAIAVPVRPREVSC